MCVILFWKEYDERESYEVYFAIAILILTELIWTLYIITANPFQSYAMNRIELINKISRLISIGLVCYLILKLQMNEPNISKNYTATVIICFLMLPASY